MEEKVLGKIKSVDVQLIGGYLLGIDFIFSLDGGSSGVDSGGKYTVNVSDGCKYESDEDRNASYANSLNYIKQFLNDAKVEKVQDLKNLPVEVIIENNMFKSFRILTEVL